jgi:hypothetical protein
VLGESQQEGVEAVGERGGDAWRPGEAGEASGGVARGDGRRTYGTKVGGGGGGEGRGGKLNCEPRVAASIS